MNIKGILGFGLGVALLTASNASAALYMDIDFPITKVTTSSPFEGEWNLLSQGYDPATEQINFAIATFLIIDDFDFFEGETFSITLDGNWFASGNAAFTFIISGITGNALLTLSEEGILEYVVAATAGDFWLKEAGVVAHSTYRDTRPTQVPDGGLTVALLGLGLVSLAGIRRLVTR